MIESDSRAITPTTRGTWGGARKGAGRKPRGYVHHETTPQPRVKRDDILVRLAVLQTSVDDLKAAVDRLLQRTEPCRQNQNF